MDSSRKSQESKVALITGGSTLVQEQYVVSVVLWVWVWLWACRGQSDECQQKLTRNVRLLTDVQLVADFRWALLQFHYLTWEVGY